MLKELIRAWRGEPVMKKVVAEFSEMLNDDEYLLNHSWEALCGELVLDRIRPAFSEKDVSVNKRERHIRRLLLEHLSINPSGDVAGCLAMMSMVKDAERIGDYCKNLFELATMLDGSPGELQNMKTLESVYASLSERMPMLQRAFQDSDQALARVILEGYEPAKTKCSDIIKSLFSQKLSTQEALATVLTARYLKRINSHVSNIATGLVYPIDKMDFIRYRDGLMD